VLLDTNVVLDLLLRREPWINQMQPLIEARDAGRVIAYLPASVLTDIFYISRRIVGITRAFEAVDRCLEDFALLALDRTVLAAARQLPGSDFEDKVQEDKVQIACAIAARLDLIVTRNTADFIHSPVPAIEPREVVRYLAP
jgi:predicted nucleic acid-binding protein